MAAPLDARDLVDAPPGRPAHPARPDLAGRGRRLYGQWQKLALARGFMRDEPLLTALDEPTAALDAETEHQLFERYAATARQARANGGVTILVSHRFSTVRMADLIVVLDGAHVAEAGSPTSCRPRRPLRRAVPHPGRGVPVTAAR